MCTCQQPDKVLDSNLITTIVDIDRVSIEINSAIVVVVDSASKLISRIAGDIIGQHKNNIGVGDAKPLDGAIYRQCICDMAVIEPEARRAHENCPVVGVSRAREKALDYRLRLVGPNLILNI